MMTSRHAVWQRVQLGFGAVGKDSPIGLSCAQNFTDDEEQPARDAVVNAIHCRCLGVILRDERREADVTAGDRSILKNIRRKMEFNDQK